MTTDRGNSWTVSSSFELMYPQPAELMRKFIEGTKPVTMAYLITGRFQSSFPEGIEIEVEDPNDPGDDPNEPTMITQQVTGLTEATDDCAVAVLADVDFISDQLAYASTFFGVPKHPARNPESFRSRRPEASLRHLSPM